MPNRASILNGFPYGFVGLVLLLINWISTKMRHKRAKRSALASIRLAQPVQCVRGYKYGHGQGHLRARKFEPLPGSGERRPDGLQVLALLQAVHTQLEVAIKFSHHDVDHLGVVCSQGAQGNIHALHGSPLGSGTALSPRTHPCFTSLVLCRFRSRSSGIADPSSLCDWFAATAESFPSCLDGRFAVEGSSTKLRSSFAMSSLHDDANITS